MYVGETGQCVTDRSWDHGGCRWDLWCQRGWYVVTLPHLTHWQHSYWESRDNRWYNDSSRSSNTFMSQNSLNFYQLLRKQAEVELKCLQARLRHSALLLVISAVWPIWAYDCRLWRSQSWAALYHPRHGCSGKARPWTWTWTMLAMLWEAKFSSVPHKLFSPVAQILHPNPHDNIVQLFQLVTLKLEQDLNLL